MSLGVLDRTPPPFFRQGTSALTKLCFFWALSFLLMVADAKFGVTQPLRATLATLLQPVERVLSLPVEGAQRAASYAQGLDDALAAEAAARVELARVAQQAHRAEQLNEENEQLRALLNMRPSLVPPSQAAEILYQASDLYSRKVIIDRGEKDGIVAGSPVVNERGVLGQVSRVYPLISEVTMLTDKDAAIPVLNSRTQARSAAFGIDDGSGERGMELRFMASNADVQPGDVLTTSGIDGVYPPGVPVATVVAVDRVIDSGFARIALKPVAPSDAVRHVLVLQPTATLLPPPPAAVVPASPKALPARPKSLKRERTR